MLRIVITANCWGRDEKAKSELGQHPQTKLLKRRVSRRGMEMRSAMSIEARAFADAAVGRCRLKLTRPFPVDVGWKLTSSLPVDQC